MHLHQQQQSQERLFVRFHIVPKKDEQASALESRPVFRDVEYVEIAVPGNKTEGVDRPVRDEDKQRFAAQYAAWKSGEQERLVGTPLTEWPLMTRSQVEEYAFYKIRTVEELAECSDSNGAKFPGFNGMKQRAKDWLQRAKDNAPAEQLRIALEQRDAQIEALNQKVKELVELHEKTKKKG